VMLPAEVLELLRQWWKARPTASKNGVAPEHQWLFPGRRISRWTTRSVRATVQGGRQSRGAAQDGSRCIRFATALRPSARARRGHSRDSSVARTFQARDDSPLQSRGDRTDCQDREPPGGSARAAPPTCEARQCGAAGAIAPPAMARPALEVADIFRDHGPAWREANRGACEPLAIEGDECDRALSHGGARRACRTHARTRRAAIPRSPTTPVATRHCPKCQGAASRRWLADREAELLPGAVLSRRVHAAKRVA